MSYRFVRITNYYPQYLAAYYAHHSGISGKSYSEQYNDLISDSIESASSYSKALNKIPGIEAIDIISNAAPLQNCWRKENNISSQVSAEELIVLQLKKFKPDVVWVDDFSLITKAWKEKLMEAVPGIKLTLGHICAPYGSTIEAKFPLFDVMFSCIPCMVEELKAKGINSYLLYHSFDADVLRRINSDNDQPESEFLFSGSLYSGAGFHNSRIEYLEALISSGIKMSLYCNLEKPSKIFIKKLFHRTVNAINKVGLGSIAGKIPVVKSKIAYAKTPVLNYSSKLIEVSHPPVFGLKLFRLMAKAKITFNIHGEVAGKCAGNIRMFEVTGTGSCLVTDWKENLHELFDTEREIVTYRSIEDCIEKVKWLLDHPEERKKIAAAGHARTLRDHTVEARVKYLDSIIEEQLKQKSN